MLNRTAIFPTVVAALLLQAGCMGAGITESTSAVTRGGVTLKITRLPCEKFVRFQAKSINIDGIDIPLGTSGNSSIVKIGAIDIEPTEIRDVSEKIQALDSRQYENCMLLVTADKNNLVTEQMINEFYASNQEFYKYVLSLLAKE